MEFKENSLCYEDYCALRTSVGWTNFSEEQTRKALRRSICTVTAVDGSGAIAMGRLVGDGMYFTIVDVVVHPACQRKGIGSRIMNMLIDFVEKETPPGGRSSIQLISEKGKEPFYEGLGFKLIPHEFCGSGMRKIIRK